MKWFYGLNCIIWVMSTLESVTFSRYNGSEMLLIRTNNLLSWRELHWLKHYWLMTKSISEME